MTMTTLSIAAMAVGSLLVIIAVAVSVGGLVAAQRGAAPMRTRQMRARTARPMQPRIG